MRSLYLLFILLFTSCGIGFQYTTLNHTGHIDGIYSSRDYTVDTLNEFQVRNKLRTDFNFRYDIAQYALSQPASFDWNNRLLGNRYSFYNPYYSRTQMWNDWVWGYNWHSPYRWSPFGYNNYGMGWSYSWNNRRWSSNQWGNPYGWNNYYGWNNGFYNRYRGTNVAYHTGRRSSTMSNRDRIGQASMIESTKRRTNRTIVNKNKPRRNFVIEEDGVRWYSGSENDNVDKEVIDKTIIKLRRVNNNIRVYENPNNIPNNIRNNRRTPVRNYNRPENNNRNSNNTIRNNNSRPNRNYNRPNTRPVRVNTPAPTRRSTPTTNSRGGKPTKQR